MLNPISEQGQSQPRSSTKTLCITSTRKVQYERSEYPVGPRLDRVPELGRAGFLAIGSEICRPFRSHSGDPHRAQGSRVREPEEGLLSDEGRACQLWQVWRSALDRYCSVGNPIFSREEAKSGIEKVDDKVVRWYGRSPSDVPRYMDSSICQPLRPVCPNSAEKLRKYNHTDRNRSLTAPRMGKAAIGPELTPVLRHEVQRSRSSKHQLGFDNM